MATRSFFVVKVKRLEKITQMKKNDYADKAKQQRDQLTEQIIGCCFKVHNALGAGFPERVYQNALVMSLRESGLCVERERGFSVRFEHVDVGAFRVDLLVEDRVILEIKAVLGRMPAVFASQLLAYLKAAQKPVGLLVNFGNPSCDIKRMALSAKSAVPICEIDTGVS